MASNFPTSLDTFTNPSSTDAMDSVSVPHATQHSDLNDAVEALEAKVGADSSAVSSSHDYKIAQLEARNEGALVFISRTTIGSAVSSVTVSGAFSSDYDNYRIIYSGGATSLAAVDIHMTLGASSTSYYSLRSGWRYANSSLDFVDANNGSYWLAGGAADSTPIINIDVMGPNLAVNTYFQGVFNAAAGMGVIGGYHDNTTQHTAFTIAPTGGTMTGGNIDVYGYAKA